MSEELDKILGGTGEPSSKEPDNKEPEKKPEDNKDPEILSKETQLANLNKAIKEANDELKLARKGKKPKPTDEDDEEDDDELEIDLKDPNAKAWDKHIRKSTDPLSQEMEAEKAEVFKFAFKAFADGKPALLASPEKMKQLIATYERIKDNTGRTQEGIINDLKRAYAAENADSILDERNRGRMDKARKDAIYADPAITRGAGNYHQERDEEPVYDDQDAAILARWGMSPQSHAQLVKELREKEEKGA